VNPKTCPNCQRPIPPQAPAGFCPLCVLRDADEPPPAGRAAPSLAEFAAAFPQFEMLSFIGQGGMGSVFKVRQPALDRVVALKILCPELGRDPAFAERFAREARVLAKLNHPNIVTVFEHGECGGFFYLLMEYVDGVNLRQAMRAGRFTPEQALAVVPGICDALQAAHAEGVWHRDIKPENILLDAQGAVKIVDFGIARLVGDPARDFTLTRTGAALGSAAYMAPEQHEKPHEVDHRADIYSLGVVIYEMLTGELPLGRFPAPSRRAAVSARIDEIVFQTLEKERELRQQSAAEVKTDVHRATRDGGPVANRPKSAELPLWVPWAVGLITGGIALLAFSRNVGHDARTAGVILHAMGGVAVVLGVMCAAFFAYVSRPAKWTAGLGIFVGLAILLLFFVGEMGVNALVLLVAATIAIWAYGASKRDEPSSPSSNQMGTSTSHYPNLNWLPFALFLLILTSAVLLGGLALMTGYDFPSKKGWVVGMGGLVFAATAAVLYAPFGSLRKRWAGFLTRFKRFHLGLAAVGILVAGLVAKSIDGNWPNANYLEVIDGQLAEMPPELDLMPMLRHAAGSRADSYQLSSTGQTFQVKTYATQHGHARACVDRLNQQLPAAVRMKSVWNDDASLRLTNSSRALVWGLASLAAVLTALFDWRRTGWLMVEGVVLFGWLMLMPVWPMPGLPKLITDPPLPPFAVAELPDTSDFSTPEKAMLSLVDAARRQQVDIVKKGVSKGLTAMLDERNQWREFIEITGSTRPLVKRIEPDLERNLVKVGMRRERHDEDIYLTKEDGRWKQDSLYVPGVPMIEPLSWKTVENASPAAAPQPPKALEIEVLLRKLNKLANESNGDEFSKECHNPAKGPTLIQLMESLVGEIVRTKDISTAQGGSRIIAEIKRPNGIVEIRELTFFKSPSSHCWLETVTTPPYRALCRIEFQPGKGDANAILSTHLGNTEFYPVAGVAGQFDVCGADEDAGKAASAANAAAEGLKVSLQKFGLDSSFKVLKSAGKPISLWPGEEEPTAEKPSP
jgi:serine/threonine protein kinase